MIAEKRRYLDSIFQRNIQTRSSLAIQLRNVNALLYDLEYSRNIGMRSLLIVLLLLRLSLERRYLSIVSPSIVHTSQSYCWQVDECDVLCLRAKCYRLPEY